MKRAHRLAGVAQERDARLDDVGDGAERFDGLGPHGAVVARVRLVEVGLPLGVRLPVEVARVDDDAADGVAVPADVFRAR